MQSHATPQELLAEKDRLESLLESSADWRALRQLEARLNNQQPLQAVSHDALAARLRLALSDNPFYQKRERVLASLQQLSEGPSAPEVTVSETRQPQRPASSQPQHAATPAFDDLTKIRNINRGLALSLNALGVVRYAQIRDWSAADVAIIRFALKLGSRISTENWIEQAALLSFTSDSSAHTQSAPATIPVPRVRSHATSSDRLTTPPAARSTAHEGPQDTSLRDKYPTTTAVTSFAMTREGLSTTSDLKPPLPLVPALYLLAVPSQPKCDAFEAEQKEAPVPTVPEVRLPPAADVPRPLPAHAFAMPLVVRHSPGQETSLTSPQLVPASPLPSTQDKQQVQPPTGRINGKAISARRRAPVEVRAAALGRTGEEAAVEIVRRDRQTGRPVEAESENAADVPGVKTSLRGRALARMFPFRSRSQS